MIQTFTLCAFLMPVNSLARPILRMCGNLISVQPEFFQDWRLVEKSCSIEPETPEKAIICTFCTFYLSVSIQELFI